MNNLSGSLSFHGDVSGQMGANLIPRVEANPSGTATEILTSIRVGDIIYSIPSGGGGGGGTNDYNSLLNKPKINNVILSGELSLSDLGIHNPVTMIGATSSADGAAGYAPRPLIADKNKFLKGDGTWSPISGSFNITNLWSYGGNDSDIYWGGSAITLNDSILNYDEIVLEIISNRDDLINQWRSSNQYLLITDILINAINPYSFTLSSYDTRSSKFIFTNTTIIKDQGSSDDNGIINIYGINY